MEVRLTGPEALLLVEHLRGVLSSEQRAAVCRSAIARGEARERLQAGTAPADRPAGPLLVDGS